MSRPQRPALYLLRHGETEWNAIRRFQGRSDSPLTARGRLQALRYAAALKRESVFGKFCLVSSPLGRATATAQIIGKDLGMPVSFDEKLVEISLGYWDGLTFDEVEAQFPDAIRGATKYDWYFRSPDGESYAAANMRLTKWLADLDRPTIAITHGLVTRLVRGIWLKLDRATTLQQPIAQDGLFHLSESGVSFLGA